MIVKLSEMRAGQAGVVRQIAGGIGCQRRLAKLGIRPGVALRVIHAAPFCGPVLIESLGVSVAVGRGMAARVEVDLACA